MAVRYVSYNGVKGMIRGERDNTLFILWSDDTADWLNKSEVTFI